LSLLKKHTVAASKKRVSTPVRTLQSVARALGKGSFQKMLPGFDVLLTRLEFLEINPILLTPERAVIVDALIKMEQMEKSTA
jgi:hypothetical protein